PRPASFALAGGRACVEVAGTAPIAVARNEDLSVQAPACCHVTPQAIYTATLAILMPESAMKRLPILVLLIVAMSSPNLARGQSTATQAKATAARYGANPTAGHTFTHDGVRLYYEVYGAGEPLLVVHGNGGSIADMSAQIDHFRKRYRVIAMDSRDQGRSGDSADALTYEKMTDDLAALLDHLKTGPVNVLGWSDGGIEALLLGVRHP